MFGAAQAAGLSVFGCESTGDFATRAKPMTNRERDCSSLDLHPFAAFSKAAMSILSISIIAFMTRNI
jgi:hypothetical protein